ncbi:MAG: BsuPI-related putative proteinase inhibitor, partial [Gemmatimonadaceae bacterium]
MSSRFVIWLLCAGAVFVAWSPHARHNESAASTTNDHRSDTVAKTDVPSSAALSASTQISVGPTVRVSLRVTNTADHAVEINFPSGKTHDVVILDATGHEVWRW